MKDNRHERRQRKRLQKLMERRAPEHEATMDRDRAWFARHPDRKYYVRFATLLERATVKQVQIIAADRIVLTLVHEVVPGVRMRPAIHVPEIDFNPEEIGEAEARDLYENAFPSAEERNGLETLALRAWQAQFRNLDQ